MFNRSCEYQYNIVVCLVEKVFAQRYFKTLQVDHMSNV